MRVPEGWVHTTFDKHTECLTGFAFKSINYSNNINDIRLLRGDNIEPNALRWRDAKYWDKAELINLQKYLLLEGDFVIALDRTWISNGLKVAEVRGIDIPCLLVQRVVRIRTKPTLAQGLLKHYFSGYKFEQYVKSVQTATAVPHISPNDIKEFPVLLPPLPEQQKIAQILSTWDKAITTTEQLLANSQHQKKALMQQLLTGKKRLLDEDGVGFAGEWPLKKLGDISDMNSGGTPKSSIPEFFDGGIPWVSIADMTKCGKRISKTEKTLSEQGLANSSARMYPKNTILFAMYASIGECSIAEIEVCSSQAILGIRPKTVLDFEYLYFYLTSLKDEIKLQGQQGTQSNLNAAMVKNFKIPLPNIDEQKKIATVLTTADREIELIQTKLEALKQEKKALMQQLLTGKRRVVINH